MLTPDRAREWIELSVEDPRKLRENQVETMARDIVNGRWRRIANAIHFSYASGEQGPQMFDGQHRVNAVIRADTPALVLVAWDMPLSGVSVIDTGSPRTLADYLHWRKEPNNQILAAIIRFAWMWENDHLRTYQWRWVKPSIEELIQFFDDNLDLRDSIPVAKRLKRDPLWIPGSVSGAWWWKTHQRFPKDVEQFVDQVVSGAGLNSGDPVLAYRRLCLSVKHKLEDYDQRGLLALLIKAFRSSYYGKAVKTLSWAPNRNERFPELPGELEERVREELEPAEMANA